MDVTSALEWLQGTGLAVQILDSLFLVPLFEAAHVIGLALVVGTIVFVDLRLLGVASADLPFRRLSSDVLKWTWLAFVLTAVTGALMFTTNATVYFHNAWFRAKILLLVLAALNVMVFELTAGRTSRQWDTQPLAPPLGRAIAIVSLAVWVGVIVTGRRIGFTTTRASLTGPAPVETNFEDLL
jgi:hypothetical protein